MKRLLLLLLVLSCGLSAVAQQKPASPILLPKFTGKPAKPRSLYERNEQPIWQDSAGVEHPLLGGGAGVTDYNALSNRPIVYSATLAGLRSMLPVANVIFRVDEWGREGDFVYDAASTLPDDDGYCVIGQSNRRFIRVNVREIQARWYGLNKDTYTDNTLKVKAARNAARRMHLNLLLADGIALNDTIHHPGRGLKIRGEGKLLTTIYQRNSAARGLFVIRERDSYIEGLGINQLVTTTTDSLVSIEVQPPAYGAIINEVSLYRAIQYHSVKSRGLYLNYTPAEGVYYGTLSNSTIVGYGVGYDCANPSVGTGGGGWSIISCRIGGNGIDMNLRDAFATHISNSTIGLIGAYTGGVGINFLSGCAYVQVTNTLFEVNPSSGYQHQFKFWPGAFNNQVEGTNGGETNPDYVNLGFNNSVALVGNNHNAAGGMTGLFYKEYLRDYPSLILSSTSDHFLSPAALWIRSTATAAGNNMGFGGKVGFDQPLSPTDATLRPVGYIGGLRRYTAINLGGLAFFGANYNQLDTLGVFDNQVGFENRVGVMGLYPRSTYLSGGLSPTGQRLSVLNLSGALTIQDASGGHKVLTPDNLTGLGNMNVTGNLTVAGLISGNGNIATPRMVAAGNLSIAQQYRGTAFSVGNSTYTDPTTTGTVAFASHAAVGQPTLAAGGGHSITYTDAPSLFVEGPPLAGTGVSITNPWSVYVLAGKSWFGDLVYATAPALSANDNSLVTAAWVKSQGYGGGGGSGEANTASNLGTGTGSYAAKSGVDLQFKSFKGGGATTLSNTSTEITITTPAQLQADWSQATSGALDFIKNKPTIPSNTSQISESGNLYYTDARARASITPASPLTYNSTSGALGIQAATTSQSGALSNTDWNTFNGKQAALGYTPENSANKGAASGYAPLNSSSQVPIANLPTGTSSTTVPLGNDSRFSDTRTPTDGTVTTAKLVDGNVTLAKLANIANATILGNNAGSSGPPIALTAAQVKTLLAIASIDVSGLGTLATLSPTGTANSTTMLRGDGTYSNALTGNFTALKLLTTGNRNITPSTAGAALSIPTSTATDNVTAASGTVPHNAYAAVAAPTFASTNTGITNTIASTFFVGAAPTAGTNTTITNSYSLYANGNSFVNGIMSSQRYFSAGDALTTGLTGTGGNMFQFSGATVTDNNAANTIAHQVNMSIGGPTWAASNAQTYTNGSTLYIGGAPTASTNVTITNPWALYVNSGAVRLPSLTLGTALPLAQGGVGATTQAGAQSTLGLVPGTNIQAFSTRLGEIAALTASNDDIIQQKAGVWTNRTLAQLKTDLNYTFDNLSPNTTLGDVTYRGASGNVRLAGNTTSTRQFFSQTGTGSASAAPAWTALAVSDIPALPLSSLSQSSATTNQVPQWNGSAWVPATLSGGGGSAYATVQSNGSGLTQRATLNFGSPFTAVDNSGSSRTDISITNLDAIQRLLFNTSTSAGYALDMPSGYTARFRDQVDVNAGMRVYAGAGNFQIADPTDATKVVRFDASPLTTATARTVTFPDASITVDGTSNTATLTNKSISGSSNTFTNIPLTTAVTGTLPSANGGNPWTPVSQASNVTNTTTTATGTSLTFTAAANTNYKIEADLIVTTTSTGGAKFSITVPSGATGAGSLTYSNTLAGLTFGTLTGSTTGFATDTYTSIKAMVFNSSTAGAVTINFALNSTSGAPTMMVKAGSILQYRITP